jgi:hypothetical protein
MSFRFVARVTALAFALSFAFTTIAATAGSKDVKGIDIIVRKRPGNAIVVHGTTGTHGSVDLGNLPKGQYELSVALPKGAPAATAGIKTAGLTISGVTAPVKASWNFETSRPFNPAASSTARAAVQDSVPFATDGQHHVVVVVSAQPTARSTSKPDIKNNLQIYSPLPRGSGVKNDIQLNVTPSPTPTPRK